MNTKALNEFILEQLFKMGAIHAVLLDIIPPGDWFAKVDLRMICTPNDCSITYIRDYSLFGQSYMQTKISELWLQTPITHFSLCHVVHTYTHNSKTQGGTKTLNLTNDCSPIGDIYMYYLGQS